MCCFDNNLNGFPGQRMNTIIIRTLQLGDADRLLQFELNNRHWFERHIASRGDAFYSIDGVREHIREFLTANLDGRLHPCLLLSESGTVIGRANLKDIDMSKGVAEVGYRIAESHVGKGLATVAVRYLIDLAKSSWQLERLVAYVAAKNMASARVLEKCDFTRAPVRASHATAATKAYTFFIGPGPTHQIEA
jgi:ribosomal-protein-alanine N-acetyltransferase